MKLSNYIKFFAAVVLLNTACKKDNYEAPESILSGKIVAQGQSVGLRSNGVQLELWQHGYAFFQKVPVYVDQDGNFSARVFDGEYKLVQRFGNGPWQNNTDSITVQVSGNTVVDMPVNLYYGLSNVSVQKSGNAVNASFNVQKIGANNVDRAALFLSSSNIVDLANNLAMVEKEGANINIAASQTLSVTIPASLASRDYLYARVGIRAAGADEYLYSAPVKIALK